MVDARSARFQGMFPGNWGTQRSRRTAMRQTELPPPPAPRTTEEAMRGTDPRSGFSRADVDLAERRGGEMLLAPLSTLTDEAKQTGALQRGTPLSYGLTAGAFLGDLFNPSVDIPVAAGIRGVGAGVKAATDPTNQARLNAMMGRMYHGVKGGDEWSTAISRPISDRSSNWFGGDLFATSDLGLADTYSINTLKKLGNLPQDLRVLDLMPGGRPLAQQSRGLAEELATRFGPDDVASMDRHMPYTGVRSNDLKDLLGQYGFNALRHVSGQGAGRGSGLNKPVYVFFGPEGITASGVGPINRFVNNPPSISSLEEAAGRIGSSAVRGADRALTAAEKGISDTLSYVPQKITSTVGSARQASMNAYQKALADYKVAEKASRKTFLETNPDPSGLFRDPMLLHVPMPPGYQALPQPTQPGAFDFLRYMFAQ